ncbi:DNA cytosine methyltransferase [Klebsiella pneumoniae]|uniref:DNA cytosine methyltransferase n=1 Tax=Klebsiella pneumoniae TaxID=573 RepID=UPI002A0A80BE|nr:DNA cytosine methyltransferase [Klebsiella pneumoniae]
MIERVNRLISKLENGESLSVCSLFHGGGVLDKAIHAGFHKAGIASAISVAVEMEGKYLDSSLANNPELWNEDSIVIESPIQAVNLSKRPPQVDVLMGGIPCTGASKSGRSKNKLEFAESHEAAGAMFFNFLQFVEALNPAVVLIENVPEYQNTASMEVIRSVLSSLGYSLQERILDGNEFGVIERRKRLCVVALSHGIDGFELEKVQPVRTKESRIQDILEPVPLDSERWKSFDYLAEKELRDKAAGKGFSRQLLTGDDEFCGTIGKDYAMQKYRTFHCSSRTAGVVSHLYTDRTLSSERDTRGTHPRSVGHYCPPDSRAIGSLSRVRGFSPRIREQPVELGWNDANHGRSRG